MRVPSLDQNPYKKASKLQLTLEIGPVADHKLRKSLLDAVKAAGFSFQEDYAYREKAKFTRILSRTKRLKQSEDGTLDDSPEYLHELAEDLWKKCWADGKAIVDVLKNFDWKK